MALVDRLRFLGGVIFGIFRQVAVRSGIGDLLESRHPGSVYRIFPAPPDFHSGGDCYPAIIPAVGNFGARSFGELVDKGVQVQRVINGEKKWVELQLDDFPPMSQKIDAILKQKKTSAELASALTALEDDLELALSLLY